MTTKKEFEDEFEKEEDELEKEGVHEDEVTPTHVSEALDRYAEDYRGKSGVDPNDHPKFAKAKELLGKMTCR
jgi:hypothetical protein